jgi:Escherichia/Staphylococcus phage prohead protease
VNRPTPGAVEERTAPATAPTVDGRKLRGLIPYGVESRDLGGWTEVVDAGALDGARLDDLIATREHDRSKLLGRHPTTLSTEDRSDGFHWAADLPNSPAGEDVRVAVERGDLRATSWRMIVAPGGERWEGNRRHVQKIAELLDVTVTAAPAYAAAAAELRSQPDLKPTAGSQEHPMAETAETTATTAATTEPTTATNTTAEDRSITTTTSGLQVEDRVTVANSARGLADEFRAAGFPGETATIPFETSRIAPSPGRAASTTSTRPPAPPARWAMTSGTHGRRSCASRSTPVRRRSTCRRRPRARSRPHLPWSARSTP